MQANNERAVKGKLGEDFTADYLVKNGYDIITRNYRKPCGEIDIVASKGDILVFVEVKTRRYRSLVSGVEAQIRYDIAEVTVSTGDAVRVIDFRYFKDAFDTTGYETQF